MKRRLLNLLLVFVLLLSMNTFTVSANEEEQKVAYEVIYGTSLSLGENTLTLSQTAITSIYKFTPGEVGIYQFVSSDANALVGYWGAGSFYVSDQTENKSSSLEYSLTQAGPSIMIGISGVETCVLTVSKVNDVSTEPTYVKIDYVNQVTPESFTLPAEVDDLVYVDVTDDIADSAVLGEDGYYHLNSADGPVLFVNIGSSAPYGAPLYSAAGYGLKACVYDDEGNCTQLINYLTAWTEYTQCQDNSKKVYPLTIDLITMFQHIGEDKGWYDFDTKIGFYLFSPDKVDEETAWMFSCCYDSDYTGKVDSSEEDIPKDEDLKEDIPKDEDLKEDIPEEDSGENPSEEPKEEEPKEEEPKEEEPKEEEPRVDKPKATSIKKVIGGKKKITVKFKKVSEIDGYEIQVALKKNMKKGKKTYTVKANNKKYIAKGLKAGKKYFVRIRTYKAVNGEKVYSTWTGKVKVKTKR